MPAQLTAPRTRSTTNLRRAVLCDARAIHALEQAAFAPPVYPFSLRAIRYNITNPRAIALVSCVYTQPAAWALTLLRDHHTGRRSARLYSIAVHPNHHSQGLARQLLAHSLDLAQQAGAHAMYLEVSTANPRAIAVYLKSGFETIKHITDYYSPGHSAFRMKHPL